MPSLDLNIAGRPLKIHCSDNNTAIIESIAKKISILIDQEKKENVPFLTSTLIAFLKSLEDIQNKDSILKETLNMKLLYENQIEKLEEENIGLKQTVNKILLKLDTEFPIE